MNPEAEAREQQTAKLRKFASNIEGAETYDDLPVVIEGLPTHLRQAANEIEDLAKAKVCARESQIVRLQRALVLTLNEFCKGECQGYEPQFTVGPIYDGKSYVFPITAKVQMYGIGTEALDEPPPPILTVRLDVSLKGNL